jgi:hypothetical protein
MLFQNPDDLLIREATAFQGLVLTMGQNELQTGLSQRGNVKAGQPSPELSAPADREHCEGSSVNSTLIRPATISQSFWRINSVSQIIDDGIHSVLGIVSIGFSRPWNNSATPVRFKWSVSK